MAAPSARCARFVELCREMGLLDPKVNFKLIMKDGVIYKNELG